jgi:multisubunit Na+/H+ antiporter MnhG subunit
MFFHDGPLAWNGVIAFWVAIIAAAAWFLVTTPVIARAMSRGAGDGDSNGEELTARVRRLEEQLAALTHM